MTAKPEKLTDAQSCERLQALIADHPNQFSQFRKTRNAYRKRMVVWSADKVYPLADNCQIWEWGAGRYNYVCDWQPSDGQQAERNFQEGRLIVENCLGNGWNAEIQKNTESSAHIIYSNSASPTIVSLRYFQEQTGWLKSWHDVVVIGDRDNLNTPPN
ncbi:MAG: hypothetical protein ACU837_01240 [Gammaproteobacteria bacterium]